MAGTLCPNIFVVLDNAGLIVNGAKIFTYSAGTSTKIATYTSASLSVANSNPVVASSAGRAAIFLDPTAGNYDIYVCPSDAADPPLSSYYTLLNVSAVPSDDEASGDITITAGENITAGQWVYLSTGDGGRTVGRWYKTDADLPYASTLATGLGVATADITSGATGNIRIQGTYTAASGLTAGTQYYLSGTAGALTATVPQNGRLVAVAYSTTAYVISFWNKQWVSQDILDPLVTGGETIAVGEVCYIATSTSGGNVVGRAYKTDEDNAYSSTEPGVIGICTVAMTAGTVGRIRRYGIVDGLSGLTSGVNYFVSTTPGALTNSVTLRAVMVGVAISTTSLVLFPWGWINADLKSAIANPPTGGGSIVLSNAPLFGAVPTFTPGAGATAATVSGCVYMNTTSTNSTNAGLQALITETLDANTLNANGKAVRITTWGTSAANANVKNVGIFFGGTATAGYITIPANYTTWYCQGVVVRTGASAQVATGFAISSNSSGAGATAVFSTADFSTPAADTTAAINISAACNTSVAADVVLKGFMIEVIN